MQRSIKVKILKESASKVTVKFVTLNRRMPMPKDVFLERVENGLYNVVGDTSILGYPPSGPHLVNL